MCCPSHTHISSITVNAFCVSAVQTLGNLSLYTWFIITISWSKEIGERPGLKQQNRHMNTGEVWPKLDFLLYGDKTAFMSVFLQSRVHFTKRNRCNNLETTTNLIFWLQFFQNPQRFLICFPRLGIFPDPNKDGNQQRQDCQRFILQ